MKTSMLPGIRVRSRSFLLLLALGFHPFPSPANAAEGDGIFLGAYNERERTIQAAVDKEFKAMGPRAYVLKGTLLYLYYPHRSEYYNVNSLGFRGGEVQPKMKNEFRVAVFGGSTVFGTAQADFQTIPFLLEIRLRKEFPKRNIRVFNLGIEGYTIEREFSLARRIIEQVRPDLLIFYHGWNDISMAYHINYADLSPFDQEDETIFAKKQDNFPLPEAIMAVSERVWMRISGRTWKEEPDLIRRKELFIQKYPDHLRKIQTYFKKQSVPALFVVQPTLATRKKRTVREQSFADIIERRFPGHLDFVRQCVAALRNTPEFNDGAIHDASDLFDGYEDELFRDLAHVNEIGNTMVAERLADIIGKSGLIDTPATDSINR